MMAPIVLFTYSRLEHTKRTVEALRQNVGSSDSDLIVFSDAAKTQQNQNRVNEVRDYIKTIQGFRTLTLHLRPYNFGLSKSIIEGVTEVLKQHESIIVLEDDMETSPLFLSYMNDALKYFAENTRIASIHGYVYPARRQLPEAFFLRGADCWGWATWRRAWQVFNPDGQHLLDELKKRQLISQFDFEGTYPFSKMLKDQIKGKNDSWAIRWHASTFLADKLTLYPGRSLVFNFGTDGSGTNCESTHDLDAILTKKPIKFSGVRVAPSPEGYQAFKDFFLQSKPGLLHKTKNLLRKTLLKITP